MYYSTIDLNNSSYEAYVWLPQAFRNVQYVSLHDCAKILKKSVNLNSSIIASHSYIYFVL